MNMLCAVFYGDKGPEIMSTSEAYKLFLDEELDTVSIFSELHFVLMLLAALPVQTRKSVNGNLRSKITNIVILDCSVATRLQESGYIKTESAII